VMTETFLGVLLLRLPSAHCDMHLIRCCAEVGRPSLCQGRGVGPPSSWRTSGSVGPASVVGRLGSQGRRCLAVCSLLIH
jgi:hypothetical protein